MSYQMIEKNNVLQLVKQDLPSTDTVDVDALTDRILAWGTRLPAFTRSHARYGALLAKVIVDGIETTRGDFVRGLGMAQPSSAYDLGLDIAWIFWLDDCFDAHPSSSSDQFLTITDFLLETDENTVLEVWSTGLIRSALNVDQRAEAAWQLWTDSVVGMVNAFQQNKRSSRDSGGNDWTYEEYISNGEVSSAVPHFIATVALIYGVDLQSRQRDERIGKLVRHLSLAMRLENDQVSLAKELDEGDAANAVLLMAQHLSLRSAYAFVEEQRQSHEDAVLGILAELGDDDPIGKAALLILEGAHWLHQNDRMRYPVLEQGASMSLELTAAG